MMEIALIPIGTRIIFRRADGNICLHFCGDAA